MAKAKNEKKLAKKAGTPSYQNFCENFRHLTEADLNDPFVQAEFAKIAEDKHFPPGIRNLVRQFIRHPVKG